LRSAIRLAPLLAVACATLHPHEKPWIEVRTEHFEIASAMEAPETLELANRLEVFRSVAQMLTNARRFDPAVPTRIYAFGSTSDYAMYGPRNSAGYFERSMRDYTIVISPDRRIATESVIQHEYAHFMIRNHESLNYPLWFSEGFAELFGALRVKGDQVQIGLLPEYRLSTFEQGVWIPIPKVVKARNLDGFTGWERNMFYAESWALVHYLHYGRESKDAQAEQITRYLSLVEAGAREEDAWRDAFGVELKSVNKKLIDYLERGRLPAFGIPVESFRPDVEPLVRAMPADEIAAELGWLSISRGRYEQAEHTFATAASANPDNGRAHVGLGDACKFQGRWDEADAHYQRGLAVAPDAALNHLDYAEYLQDRAVRAEDAEQRAEFIRQARRHYVRSQKLNPELPETYAMYGSTFLIEGEEPERGLETLEHAHALLRSDLDIKMMLASLYIELDRDAEARELLQTVVAWAHGEGQADAARELLRQLDGAESGLSAPEAVDGGG
jgi:tetratricopeptide (TPR) repeat protein